MSDDVGAAIRDVLVGVARRRDTITYEALLAALDEDDREVARDRLAALLREVSVAEDVAGRGLLTAIVVRENEGLPGAGWFRLAADRGRDVNEQHETWRREVDSVYAAWAGAT